MFKNIGWDSCVADKRREGKERNSRRTTHRTFEPPKPVLRLMDPKDEDPSPLSL
jgi:hypothetical protein